MNCNTCGGPIRADKKDLYSGSHISCLISDADIEKGMNAARAREKNPMSCIKCGQEIMVSIDFQMFSSGEGNWHAVCPHGGNVEKDEMEEKNIYIPNNTVIVPANGICLIGGCQEVRAHAHLPNTRTMKGNIQILGEPESVLEVLFFVVDDTVFGKTMVNTLAENVNKQTPIGSLLVNSGTYNFIDRPFDQIRSDVESWVAGLSDTPPVSRIERQSNGDYFLIDADNERAMIFSPYQWMLLSHCAGSPKVYEPTSFTAEWTELTRKCTTADLPSVVPVSPGVYRATDFYAGIEAGLEYVNALQSDAFQVWRLEVKRV